MTFVTIYPKERTMITVTRSPYTAHPVRVNVNGVTPFDVTKEEARSLALALLKLTGEACPTLCSNGGYSAIVDDACGDPHHATSK